MIRRNPFFIEEEQKGHLDDKLQSPGSDLVLSLRQRYRLSVRTHARYALIDINEINKLASSKETIAR